MHRIFLMLAACAVSAHAVADPHADSVHVTPVSAKALDATLHVIPQDALGIMLAQPVPHHVYDVYAGQNDALAAAAEHTKPMAVGAGYPTDLDARALFGPPRASWDGTSVDYVAAITSIDAVSLRLQVDVSSLRGGDRLYVIDPTGPRAYGPYGADAMVEDGRWLPTIEGDTAVLLVSTADGALPELRLVGVSHFYRRMDYLKVLACNINAACLTDPGLVNASAGVGIMVRTRIGGDSGVCSGTLINNPDTPENEPYYLTANHCIPGAISVQNADIIWDFRTATCLGTNPPPLSSLPRSDVLALLETDSSLDISLLLLDAVPSGIYGRTYVGWDTRVPSIGEDVAGIHHPDGSYMRVSFGDVTAINQPGFGTLPYIRQTEVLWAQGVTEGGSSGSCLLFENSARILGVLSNGPTHSCTDSSRNRDRYASFRDFFPQIEEYLTDGSITGPAIQLSATTHAFGSTHEPWVLEIWNGHDASTLTFTIANLPPWLNASRMTGQSTGPDDVELVTFTVIPEQLSPTFNSATIEIAAPGAAPRTVVVTAWGPKALGCSGSTRGALAVVWGDVGLAVGVLLVLAAVHHRERATRYTYES